MCLQWDFHLSVAFILYFAKEPGNGNYSLGAKLGAVVDGYLEEDFELC